VRVRLRVTYDHPADLEADHETQISRGGLLVRGDPPSGLTLYEMVELEIGGRFPPLDRGGILVSGQVVQIVAGVGVAVVFDATPVTMALAASRAPRPAPPAAIAAGGPPPPRASDTAAKINLALHGNRDDRQRILRDTNRMLHAYVLRNPGLGLDEVLAIAKMATVAPDLLVAVAAQKEWATRQDIAIALVRNPRTPTPTAIRLLEHVTTFDLRQLAKDTHTRPSVQQAARKKLLGGT
jgi:hypothetical protein